MAENLTVKISADVGSLPGQIAVAKTSLSDLNATVKSLATQFVAASDDMKGSLAPQLDAAAQQAAAAKAQLAALNAEMKGSVHPEVTGFFGQLSESARITGESFETLHARLSVFSGALSSFSEFVVAGLALEQVSETINKVAESGEQLEKLSQETGLTTEQLSGLKVIATETGTSFDEFARMIDKLPSTMQEAAIDPSSKAGQAFAALGIKVTGTNGQLLPMGEILDELSAKLLSYADGTNKTAIETDILGAKIGASLIPMFNQLGLIGLPGAIEKSNELNQTWTGESAEAAEQYEQDMGRAKLAVEGITDSIVRGLLPALDALANAMAPTLNAQITSTQARINAGGRFAARPSAGLDTQLADLQAQKAALDASAAQQAATVGGAAPGTVQAPTLAPKAADGADFMKQQDATLAQQNEQIEQTATTTKQANAEKLANTVQFWQSVLQAGNLTSAEELAAQNALTKAETAQRAGELSNTTSAAKAASDQQTQIAADAAEARKEIAASEYQAQQSVWDAEVATGKISKEQEIQDEQAAENQMYEAALAEANQEADLDAAGTAAKAKALDDIEVLTAAHNATMAKLSDDLVTQQMADAKKLQDEQTQAAAATSAAWQKAFQPISQAFDTSINGIIQGTETLKQAETKAAASIALAFIDAEAKKVVAFAAGEAMILARGLGTELGLTAASTAGNAARLASKATADAAGRAEDVALGTAQISGNAMKAASGAYAAIAGIPYVGPVLAPAAAATAYAAVMAFDVLSAEGGLAIGPGVNPLVQLHENETVLPAYIAQPLQAMAQGGGFGGGGDTTHITNNLNMNANVGNGGDFVDRVGSALNDLIRSGSMQKYPAVARMMRR